jgi:hypothetical protein
VYKTANQIIKEAKAKATREYNKKRKADNKVFQRFSGIEKLTKGGKMLEEIRKEIPEAEVKLDYFGGNTYYIPPQVLSKRKSWNMLVKRGFQVQPNKEYLRKGNIYAHNNTLINYLLIVVNH